LATEDGVDSVGQSGEQNDAIRRELVKKQKEEEDEEERE